MRLSEYLALQKIKPSEFARRIEVSRAAVARYISGDRFPEPSVLIRIRDVTDGDVTPDDFLSEVEAAE